MTSFLKGHQAEDQALHFFLDRGYVCLAKRFKTRWGEIDLIVSTPQHLHFVEVKRRSCVSKGLFSLRPTQQERIYKAALSFLSSCPPPGTPWSLIQFDLVIVTEKGELTYWPHIFTAEGDL